MTVFTEDSHAERRPVVLVVDDHDAVRKLLNVALQRQGFDVWLAASGEEAVGIYEHHLGDVDLVLLDVLMPGLDGPQTLDAIRTLDPAVRCCFMTGDAGAYRPDELLAKGAARVFDKPFVLADLAQTLRALLHTPARPRAA
jgi:CheY-like chemotaxis protein